MGGFSRAGRMPGQGFRRGHLAEISEQFGAGGGNRTHTGSEPHGILSPARLPVSPLRQRRKPAFYRTSSFRAELLHSRLERCDCFGLGPYTPSAANAANSRLVRLQKAASLHFTTFVLNEVRGSNDS